MKKVLYIFLLIPAVLFSEDIVLTAGKAKINGSTGQGNSLKLHEGVLAYWSNADSYPSWKVKIPKDGSVKIKITQAQAYDKLGNYKVFIGDKSLDATVKNTGGWFNFEDIELGELELKAGEYTVSIKAVGPLKGGLMNVKKLTLSTAGASTEKKDTIEIDPNFKPEISQVNLINGVEASKSLQFEKENWSYKGGFLFGQKGILRIPISAGDGDFELRANVKLKSLKGSYAQIKLTTNAKPLVFGFDSPNKKLFLNGLAVNTTRLKPINGNILANTFFKLHVYRKENTLHLAIDGKVYHSLPSKGAIYGIHFHAGNKKHGEMSIKHLSMKGHLFHSLKVSQSVTVFPRSTDTYKSFANADIEFLGDDKLLAVAEARLKTNHNEESHIVGRISSDKGKTWGEIFKITSNGTNCLRNPVISKLNNKIYLVFTSAPSGIPMRSLKEGHEGPTSRIAIKTSEDGKTWAKTLNITPMVKFKTNSTYLIPSKPKIFTEGKYKGRIVLPIQSGPQSTPVIYTAMSDDGKEWKHGNIISGLGTWPQLFTHTDKLVLYAGNPESGKMKKAISSDGGLSWTNYSTNTGIRNPNIRFGMTRAGKKGLYMTMPHHYTELAFGTLLLSKSLGNSVEDEKLLSQRYMGPSSLTRISDEQLAMLFENLPDSKNNSIFSLLLLSVPSN